MFLRHRARIVNIADYRRKSGLARSASRHAAVAHAATPQSAHAHRHLERQFDQAADRQPAWPGWPSASPTSSACRKPMRRRRLPARADRGARLQCRSARPEGLQRRRHPVEAPVRRGDAAACPATTTTTTPGSSRRCLDQDRRGARRLPLSAQRQPADTDKYPYKLKWMDRLISLCT